MKNTFGQSVAVTLFGESHGRAIGAVIDGLAPGIKIDEEYIKDRLSRRRPSSSMDTARREPDNFQIVSGVFEGYTTGTPICIIIPNEDKKSGDYFEMRHTARPSHADYTAYVKYHGFEDYRGGGHFSGRITAPLVAAGAIATLALARLGIKIGTHISYCGGVKDSSFGENNDIETEIDRLNGASFPVLNDIGSDILSVIDEVKSECDSIGGIVETAVTGVPAGVGEPWFDSVESMLSHALFSLGGVKGIEFGDGFDFASLRGSEANDPFFSDNGKIMTKTNRNGGINGGITNGMPIIFRCAVKPTPSISREQDTVDFVSGENKKLSIKGRHDPAIIRRICPVIDAVAALVICDMLAARYGTDVFTNGETKK